MAEEAMDLLWEELDNSEVHIRDKWQFALKSDFIPKKPGKSNLYTQEFYLFIPSSLQINSKTYSKELFYLDQTNLIRYKTPQFSFEQLLDANTLRSPLNRIIGFSEKKNTQENRDALSDELKLLANVVRSTLRREVKLLVYALNIERKTSYSYDFTPRLSTLCNHIKHLRERYAYAEYECLRKWNDHLFYRQMLYIDEFLSYSISNYMTKLLESIRLTSRKDMEAIDKTICDLLLNEKQLSDSIINNGNKASGDTVEGENILYRYSLLNKFVLDALHLATNRFSLDQRYQHWIAASSAGIAMMIYFLLFVWLGNVFVINSAPFVLLTVVCYVLKDRIKEWLRNLSYLHASKWFSDYTTIIKSQETSEDVGIIKESFSFIEPLQLSDDLKVMRNAEFHAVLETVPRPENILFYKRVVQINSFPITARRYGINVIFRFNIHHFLRKAGDPSETHLAIDPETKKLISIRLPKVYHLNLIIRSISFEGENSHKIELNKLRIVIDKNGIKRIEQLSRSKNIT